MSDITFFVACYNEERGILPTIETIVAAAGEFGCSYDIVIIDDASVDRSVQLIEAFVAEHPDLPIRLVVNDVNLGLGHNFAEAAFHGTGKYYRLVCGDNVEPKETLVALLSRLGEADLIIPYHRRTDFRGPTRRIMSWLFTATVNLISGFNIRYYNGLPVFLRYDVMRWHSNSNGFGFQADLVTRLLDMGATFIQVPVSVHERAEGSSKALTLQNLCSVGHSLLDILIRRAARIAYPNRVGAYQGRRQQRMKYERKAAA